MTKKESDRIKKLEGMLEKLLEATAEENTEAKATTKKSNKSTAKDVELVNKAICKILNKTTMKPAEFVEVHRFGKKTSLSLMPASDGNKAYVDGTRALYMTVSIENTRDGWDNFMAIMLNLQKKFESHNAFYKQVRVKA
jgi:hypothetical protein